LENYGAPLFVAWQLTNGCTGACLACCEESGRGHAWPDELSAGEALAITQQIIDLGVPYVAFGGGEPLGVPHCWDIFERLAGAGIAIKLETNGILIDNMAAARLRRLGVECVQLSLDAASAAKHDMMRPGTPFVSVLGAVDRLVANGVAPQWVFVPTRLNIHDMVDAFYCAVRHGCSAFVTGPLMRLGRAAASWSSLACDPGDYDDAVTAVRRRAAETGAKIMLAIYPWDILTELTVRLETPQAMLLVVPNGKIKLLNALPFSPADLRRVSLAQAWQAYRQAWRLPVVRDFIAACQDSPDLLLHANETWEMPGLRDAAACAA
jgi:MoaA/NifB/PqqE/SkfB family radical SAM enzyme